MHSELTPVHYLPDSGIWLKRDDAFQMAGQAGGKVRSCLAIIHDYPRGTPLVTASARVSPQQLIVASLGQLLAREVHLHVPASKERSETLERAAALGLDRLYVHEHRPGHNSVIAARARTQALENRWAHIPFGMEHWAAVEQTRNQVRNIPDAARRLVVPVGSGMSLAGILVGMLARGVQVPILGVMVGADPTRRLDKYAPAFWRQMVDLVPAGVDYHVRASHDSIDEIRLDPYYEAKCVPYLRPGDCLWIVGNRTIQ